jgi:putative DNA primase/helicase
MAISIERAKALVIEFCAEYPVASKISYKLRNTQEEALDEPKATIEREGRIYGAYFPGRGYAAFAVSNFRDEAHFRGTLRHEILGHFGINTFNPQEKRAVLEAIIQARDVPGMRDAWAVVDRAYSGLDDLRKAEEVYAFSCEAIEPNLRTLVSPGAQALQEVCLERRRPLTFEDLINLTTMVAEGLHDRTRSQQNFPASDSAQFKQDSPMKTSEYPVWLAVPPDDRDKVRATAGKLSDGRAAVVWDRDAKLWCARPGCDLERIHEWLPDRSRRAGGGDPEAEFLDVLTQAGLIVKGMPVMDGTRQRVATIDDKRGKQSGVYCGFLDRRPGGWFINYHSADSAKDVTNWSASGGESDPITSLHIRAAARQSQDDVTRERAAVQAAAASAAKQLYDRLPAADPAHPYLVRKGIPPTPDLRQTRNGALVVPFFNAAGIFKTLQYIPPEGEKYLFENAPKQEHFLVVGGPLDPARPILYAEGYATARSLNLATDLPVVMTIDAGNMVAVARVLHLQYPDARHLFMADFDHAKGVNKGLIMATEAADLVGGQVLYPAFSADEIAQGFTDFNDLHHSRGLDAVREQTSSLIAPRTEISTMPDNSIPQAEPTVSVIPSAVRKALEQEWSSQQADFLSQQLQIGSQMKEELRSALKVEKSDLKSQLLQESKDKSFGERLAASAGLLGHGEKQSQITNINRALKQLDKSEHDGFKTRTFDGQLVSLREDGQFAIERGQANPSAIGELAKSRETWVQEQAAARLGPEGLAPFAPAGAELRLAEFEAHKQERVAQIVSVVKDNPWKTVELANLALHLSVQDHSAVEAQRFSAVELQATGAIDARAEAFVDTVAALPKAEVVELAPEDVRQWATLDNQDLALIEVEELREYAADVMADNGQAAPSYAQALASIDAPASAPAPEVTPEVAPAGNPEVQPGLEQSAPESQVIDSGNVSKQPLDVPATVEEHAAAVIEPEVPAVAVEPAVEDMPAAVSQPSDTASVIDATSAGPVAEPPRMAVEIPENASSLPEPPSTVATDQVQTAEATADVAPEARPAMASGGPIVEDDMPVSSNDQVERPLPPRSAPVDGDVAVENPAFDGIVVGARIGKDEPALQASLIDKDALLARIDHEIQRDNSVLYTLDAQPAFVDRGSRLEMVPGASQSDDKVMAALLTAAQFYRGRIELTGSDAFKAKAIHLIAQHQINVTMKNPAQQLMLEEARKALNVQAAVPEAIHGDTPPAFDVSPAPYVPMDVALAPAEPETFSMPLPASVQPLGADIEPAPAVPVVPPTPRIDPALHQSPTAAKEGVTGKILQCGKAPFRFEEGNTESAFIKMRTKQGVQTFWGKELAGLLRETRIEPGKMATLKWLGNEQVIVKVPIKDAEGATVRFENKEAMRNQWSLVPLNGPSVRTGNDEGVKLSAYDAARFAMIQNSVVAQLKLQIDPPPAPKGGLFWMTPDGQGSAKAGDELSAPRPELDKDNAGRQVMSSWSQDGRLDMALFRGDGPYLQGVVRQGDEYQHVLVSLPGHAEAPPMVLNAVTDQGLLPIGVGNGINRSGGEPVQRDHVAYRLEGDTATRIGKLDNPADVPPALHHRLGFDERWKDDNSLPKSKPAAAPVAQPSEMRPS